MKRTRPLAWALFVRPLGAQQGYPPSSPRRAADPPITMADLRHPASTRSSELGRISCGAQGTGMGEVFLADDASLHSKGALKFPPPEMPQDVGARSHPQEKLRSRLQTCEIGALSVQSVTGAPCSMPCTLYGTVRCATSVAEEHIQATSDGW